MNERHTVVRALHDVGGAVWLGGSLMGAVGVNGASAAVQDSTDRARVASAGWAKWAPVSALAIAAHVAGGIGLLMANRGRIGVQRGAMTNTAVKTALTLAAIGATAYSGVLGTKVAKAGKIPAGSGTMPADDTPADIASAQAQLRALQWATPALTAAVVALGSQQGEQQRPSQLRRGVRDRLAMIVRR